jgi:CRISPR-associated protein Cas2
MRHVIAYDIADPQRLRRVARFLERRALRCQKSVFLFEGEPAALVALLDELAPLLCPEEDVVQGWGVRAGGPALGVVRGTPLNLYPAAVVLHGQGNGLVARPAER